MWTPLNAPTTPRPADAPNDYAKCSKFDALPMHALVYEEKIWCNPTVWIIQLPAFDQRRPRMKTPPTNSKPMLAGSGTCQLMSSR